MNRLPIPLAALAGALMPLVFDSALKGAALLAFAAFATLAMWRASAAARHLVWLVAIVALLVVPVLSVALPQWQVLPKWATAGVAGPVPVAGKGGTEGTQGTQGTGIPPGNAVEVVPLGNAPLPATPASTDAAPAAAALLTVNAPWPAALVPAPAWRDWLPLAWVAGFTLLALRLLAAHLLLRRASRDCPALAFPPDEKIGAAFAEACTQLGLRRRVKVLLDKRRNIPVVWGVFRPRLMLPVDARGWSDDQLRSVFLHELAHLKRRDTLVQWLTQIACALHWWNPLVWLAAWRLHVERERACDDLVLASGVRPSAYAEHLLDVATNLSPARWTAACGLAMARQSSLEGRLRAVLSEKLNRRRVSSALAAAGLLLGSGIAIPIAMLRAADEAWNPPRGAHIGSNDFSALCVHDGQDATFVIAYHGDFDSTGRSSSNAKARTWTDDVTLTAKQPGIALSFYRTHLAPGKLSITTAPAEGRNPGPAAPPLRESGPKEYDLAKGRVFLLADDGAVRQLDITTPLVTSHEAAEKLAALIAGIPPQTQEAAATPVPMSNRAGKLQPGTIAKLKWGESVNGLRMALAYPPALRDVLLGVEEYYQLVVQNVSEKALRFTASDDAPNPRSMQWREGERTIQALSDRDAQTADWQLAPGECGVLRLFTKEERSKDGKTISAMLEGDLVGGTRYHVIATMEIAKAPAGSWTGKLVTGPTRGPADVTDAPAPKHKDARVLYEIWQRHARENGDIPGALIGELAAAVKTFIGYNPTWETVPRLDEILPRLDATRDWKPADASALLDEVAAVQDSPLQTAAEKTTAATIRQGDALPEKFAGVAWGETQPNGLRAAWVLEPGATGHRMGTALKARLLVQNTGTIPVMTRVPTWHQGEVKASDAKGAVVEVSGISWTTIARLVPVRLAPGEFIEIKTPGIGLGPHAGMGPWAGPRVGWNILKNAGADLTLTHSPVPLDGSGVGVREDDPQVVGPGWWLAHIKGRLSLELPLPADAAERTRLLDRAVPDLFGTTPSAEETAAFVSDKTPDALDSLAKRLAAREDVVSFSGKLPTAPVKFRVLAAHPGVDKMPRVVLGPGEYPVGLGTVRSGPATLKIVGRPVGDRRTNDAQILFEATEATGKLAPDPHKLEVPDGWGTWAIVCRPGDAFLYLLHQGGVRKIDYSVPGKVTDTPATDLPAGFRDEVMRQLEIEGVSDAEQVEIIQAAANPAASAEAPADAVKGAAVKLEPAGLIGTWRGLLNGERLLLSFHRTPADEEVHADMYAGDATVGMRLSMAIKPDGSAVNLTGNHDMDFGRLTPMTENVLMLELSGRQFGQTEITITRDAAQATTEPQQAEARALFEMWKRTANDDGTIPGTFIGMLASEVRAYVKANPSLDSGMKLPKLLPRFVTSRDWTQAEAIQLLDDVAYYSTAPIEARVAKAKLPGGPLWRTMVEFEDMPVQIAQWSEEKDGLRLGMRVVEGDWRVGGKARVELWVHNAGGKDITFKTTGTERQDVGVAVSAIDAEGREHRAENSNVLILAVPMDCTLPAGHVAMAKKIGITFAGPDSDEKAWFTPRFRSLEPGAYQLRCTWTDASPTVPKESGWTGELTAPEHAFTLAANVATADVSKPAPKLAKLPDESYAKPGVPIGELAKGDFQWSEAQDGLSLGMSVPEAGWRVGSEVKMELWVRNPGAEDVKLQHIARRDIGLRVFMIGADDREHEAAIAQFDGWPVFNRAILPAGHAFEAKKFSVVFLPPGRKPAGVEPHFTLPAGDYKFRTELSLPGTTGATRADGTQVTPAEGEWSGTLSSAEVDVKLTAVDGAAAEAGAEAAAGPPAEAPGRVVVTIAKDGSISLGPKAVTLKELESEAAGQVGKPFTIRSHKTVPYSKVVEVLETLRMLDIADVAFGVLPD